MKHTLTRSFFLIAALALLMPSAHAATFIIDVADGPGEGFNDPTPVAPLPGNPATTLGEQRLNVFYAAAARWGSMLASDVEIRVRSEFNPMSCGVLGSSSQLGPARDFPGAPIAGTWYQRPLADALSGTDRNPALPDLWLRYNSDYDNGVCAPPGQGWYYGLDGIQETGVLVLYPVVLHEMSHGLGFATFVDKVTGQQFQGWPDIYSRFTYDVTAGLHWPDMTNGQRAASAINTGNVVFDGPETKASADDFLTGENIDLVVNGGPAAGTYATGGALFGAPYPETDGLTLDMEIVNDGSPLPTEGCNPLVGFTPGRIAFVDRGTCEFGVKSLNAENAGAGGVIIANNIAGTILMAPGQVGRQVTILVVAMTLDDGNIIRTTLPQSGTFNVLSVYGMHANGFPLLYTPNPVELGSTISHFDATAGPNALMEPAVNDDLFDDLDMTPAAFSDEGWTVMEGGTPFFEDGFESGDTTMWGNVVP